MARSEWQVVVIVSLAVCFGCACSAQVKAVVGLGSESCRRVDVPGTPPFLWSVDPTTVAPGSLNLVFQADDLRGPAFRVPAEPSVLYFAAVPGPGLTNRIGPFSKEKYAVGVHGSEPVRQIEGKEWRLGQPLAHFNAQVPPYNIEDNDDQNVLYKGKEFVRSGEHLSISMVSANDRWIAVFSYDGKQVSVPPERRGGSIGIPGMTKHPREGELYADIYNVETGRKAIAMRGTFKGQIASNWFLTAFFLEDRYFFLNTGEETDEISQFWICELPPGK